MGRVIVLMYHALYDGEREYRAIDDADRPYAVSVDEFDRQLQSLEDAGVPVLPPGFDGVRGTEAPRHGVVLTFDDGHASNWRHAWPCLAKRGLAGAFFVTTEFIGARAGFCTWKQVCEMADTGMTIGGHGCSHRFFADMDESTARKEMRESHDIIEQEIGGPVTQMSFPGGRYRPEQIGWGMDAGFRMFHCSRVATLRRVPTDPGSIVPRIPIRASTSLAAFRAISKAAPAVLWPAQAAFATKVLLQRMLGNRWYHFFYEHVARRP
jgi:Predicted xylanase/chitin deacetylase